jgi:hypothetical protein
MSDLATLQLSVWRSSEPPRADLPVTAALAAEAQAKGLEASLLIWSADPEAAKIMAKKRHDLKAALRTLGFAAKAIEGGYTFQDDQAKAKAEAIAKAVKVLEAEGETLALLFG